MFDESQVLLRRAQQDGHLVERHARSGFVEDTSHHLGHLARFSGRREEPHVAGRRALGGPLGAEDEAA